MFVIWLTTHGYAMATGRSNVNLFCGLTTLGCCGLLLTMQWVVFYYFTPISWLIPSGLLALTLVSWHIVTWLQPGR